MLTDRLKSSTFVKPALICLATLCLAGAVYADAPGLRYTGRVVYHSNKANAGSLQIELVEAKDSGEPTNKILGSTRADADGHFILVQTETTDRPVALTASAVRESADSGGDRTQEGYDIKSHLTRLGYLLNPSPVKSNTVYVEGRRPGKQDE